MDSFDKLLEQYGNELNEKLDNIIHENKQETSEGIFPIFGRKKKFAKAVELYQQYGVDPRYKDKNPLLIASQATGISPKELIVYFKKNNIQLPRQSKSGNDETLSAEMSNAVRVYNKLSGKNTKNPVMNASRIADVSPRDLVAYLKQNDLMTHTHGLRDSVGADGRQATMKDGPEDYLDGQKLVGGS